MGLTNPDVFVFNNGVEKANTYISFANETLYVRQGQPSPPGTMMPSGPGMSIGAGDRLYRINANYSIYWDKQARFSGKPYIQQGYVTATFEDPTPINVYEILYDVLKQSVFPNAFDSIANDPNSKVAEETSTTTEETPAAPAAAPEETSTTTEETPAAPAATEETPADPVAE